MGKEGCRGSDLLPILSFCLLPCTYDPAYRLIPLARQPGDQLSEVGRAQFCWSLSE